MHIVEIALDQVVLQLVTLLLLGLSQLLQLDHQLFVTQIKTSSAKGLQLAEQLLLEQAVLHVEIFMNTEHKQRPFGVHGKHILLLHQLQL